jgi:hypothetical protein
VRQAVEDSATEGLVVCGLSRLSGRSQKQRTATAQQGAQHTRAGRGVLLASVKMTRGRLIRRGVRCKRLWRKIGVGDLQPNGRGVGEVESAC